MKTLVCDCNHSMRLDDRALAEALGTPVLSHSQLCRRQVADFQEAARGPEDLVVACTQEARLFGAVAAQTPGAARADVRPIRFVNIREIAGWSQQGRAATPKMVALLAAAQQPAPDPVPTVHYASGGRCLVMGDLDSLQLAIDQLGESLELTLLNTGAALGKRGAGALPAQRSMPTHTGRVRAVRGWLGAFEVEWESSNPIDPDLCTHCNACVKVCPQDAIGLDYQIDRALCTACGDCVRACGEVGAIDLGRAPQVHAERFDLVLDLQAEPALRLHQLPVGYYAPGADVLAFATATGELREQKGAFEKPRFAQYEATLCAHSRNGLIGCQACLDVCSAQAIVSRARVRPDQTPPTANTILPTAAHAPAFRDQIEVEAHLCAGCGACTTVCPTGALTYMWPRAGDLGARLRTLLGTARRAGLARPALLLHGKGAATQLLYQLGRLYAGGYAVQGVPAHVIPVELWHIASVGMDLWLASAAWGAAEIVVLASGDEAPAYIETMRTQLAATESLLHGMGYTGARLALWQTQDAHELDALLNAPRPEGVVVPEAAGFAPQARKRANLELALDHLMRHAPVQAVAQGRQAIALPHGGAAAFGSITVDQARCTLCLSCVGACPAGALLDNPQTPQLRFVEKNCVQCGLCVKTCPEDAIRLDPRLQWGPQRAEARVLHEVQPWHCIRCGKPFGTVKAIEQMQAKLAAHPAFAGEAAQRLQMCPDCRVIDLHSQRSEARVSDAG